MFLPKPNKGLAFIPEGVKISLQSCRFVCDPSTYLASKALDADLTPLR